MSPRVFYRFFADLGWQAMSMCAGWKVRVVFVVGRGQPASDIPFPFGLSSCGFTDDRQHLRGFRRLWSTSARPPAGSICKSAVTAQSHMHTHTQDSEDRENFPEEMT